MTKCKRATSISWPNRRGKILIRTSSRSFPRKKCSRWVFLAEGICATAGKNFPRVGFPQPNFIRKGCPGTTGSSIFLEWRRANRSKFGARRAGSENRILEAGSNGIADIIWAGEARMTSVKSGAGGPSAGTSLKSKKIAIRGILIAAKNKDRPFFIGLMTAGKCKKVF